MSGRELSEAEVRRLRAETPGCAVAVHLDNAGAALPPLAVTNAVVGHLHREARVGGYRAAAEAETAATRPYAALASLLGCSPEEIALFESATRAWDMAFYAVPLAAGDRVVTARAEYASNAIALLQVTRRTGAHLVVVDDDPDGQVDVAALGRELVHPRTRLVALTHVPTFGGLVNPAGAVGALCRAAGVPFLLDACQSAGQLDLDVGRLGCDLLAATGRKYLRAPRGTGFLFARRGLLERLEPPMLDLRAATWTSPTTYQVRPDARRFEVWEHSVADRIGLGVAVDYALGVGLPAIETRVTALGARLREQLAAAPGVTVHDRGRRRCGIVGFSVRGWSATEVRAAALAAGVTIWVSGGTSAQFARSDRGSTELARASVHYYNTESDCERLVGALPRPR